MWPSASTGVDVLVVELVGGPLPAAAFAAKRMVDTFGAAQTSPTAAAEPVAPRMN
jgi:hypothetical protein